MFCFGLYWHVLIWISKLEQLFTVVNLFPSYTEHQYM